MQATYGTAPLDVLPLPRRGIVYEAPGGSDLRTPTHRLVAVPDDTGSVERAIRRHAAEGWTYVEPEVDAGLYFGQRMLAFHRHH